MIDSDDLEPTRPKVKLLDLQPMSVGELRDYIASLENEIMRAKDAIMKKEAHKSGIEALFGSSKTDD